MATSNAATTYLENKLLAYIFKNDSGSFSSPGDSIYVGLATAVSDAEAGSLTEAAFGAYARQQVTAANWTLASSSTDQQTVTNTNNIEFPASTVPLRPSLMRSSLTHPLPATRLSAHWMHPSRLHRVTSSINATN